MSRRGTRTAVRIGSLLCCLLLVSACSSWRGLANVPMPGGPGTGKDHWTIFVELRNTLALNVNSRVRVADVFVGRVSKIELRQWKALVTLDLDNGVRLPRNATAKVGQTSVLGSQHVELEAPPDASPQPLVSGDTIPLSRTAAYPTTERTLASIAMVLRGGGISNLETISTELDRLFTGRADQIREFLNQLDTFVTELNGQRDGITRALDATNGLLKVLAAGSDVVDAALTELPPLIEHFDDKRELFADATTALGRLSRVTGDALEASRADLENNLRLLQRPLTQLGYAAPYVLGALKVLLTAPFNIDDVPKVVRGDYVNISATLDFTLSAIDNALLSGTGFSGALRALEQAWGRDPATMIPDVRYTPNPADLPPERGR
ncbi:phospholipid/cholesterol/gamma-HCH transport system substrate-binding protein [Mycolicibacterium iranicum]|uniref:Phospholipid/cholesterol/gamma-HCH transport system substrate-binding protein n=1 Tax=Mycolicibacterium iranicum TaxID=912594 RepID=A0A839Q4F4_MYCIR|nr:MCE family protein [Mycolicibacterium iranicum]MBB2989774.1 phospholipid/cholesterol/gamma-HCH transport system substrate-binding protein [Mycolicibacterium iranicum]